MAAVAPSSEQAADLLQNLSLDSQPKTAEALELGNKNGPVFSTDPPNGLANSFNQSGGYVPNGFLPPAYYFGGYDGQGNPWSDYSIYVNADGQMAQNVYGDNCSYMFPQGYGYPPYGPYTPPTSPAPTLQPEGQLYGMQHYQYHSPYYQNPAPNHGSSAQNKGNAQAQFPNSVAADQLPSSFDLAKANNSDTINGGVVKDNNGLKPLVAGSQDKSLNVIHDKASLPPCITLPGYPDLRACSNGFQSRMHEVPSFSTSQKKRGSHMGVSPSIGCGDDFSCWNNKNLHPPHFMNMQNSQALPGLGLASCFRNEVFSGNRIYGRYGNTLKGGSGYGSGGYGYRTNGRGLAFDGKYKTGGFGSRAVVYGKENFNGFNEMNKGPRAKGGSNRNQKGICPVTLLVKGQSLPASDHEKALPEVPNKEEFSGEDFAANYENAKFFVIKSYSEDDIHKSIKYGVWASTPNGNKKLNAAYLEAKEKLDACPIFLLFSVNASGQFVGLAEMVGPVDFDKTVEYWQQDRWNGCFPVKWRIIKDIPNSLLKHITLENNENKPVTNSRDTQEVKLEQGNEIVKVFKSHACKTCILDDFEFYEARQMTMQESKSKERQFWKQATKVDDFGGSEKNSITKSLDVTSVRQSVIATVADEADTEAKAAVEVKSVIAAEDGSRPARLLLVSDREVGSSGVASAC